MNEHPKEGIVPVSADNSEHEKHVSRRKLLKLMAVTGGVVATSQLIPGEWVKPVIGFGTLPAHAQGSAAPLTSTTILGTWNVVGPDPGGATTWNATATFNADGTLVFVYEDGSVENLTWSMSGSTLTVDDNGSVESVVPVGDSTRFVTGQDDPDGTTVFTR
jgi:hypothetical protein